MKISFLLAVILSFLLAGCIYNPSGNQFPDSGKGSNQYANGFRIIKEKGYVHLMVYNPWQQADNVLFNYYLVNKNDSIPDSIKNETIIRTPVQRVICMATTHIAFVDCLGMTERIVGISGKNLIYNKKIREAVNSGKVFDVGYEESLNYELMAKLKPDVVFFYGLNSEVSGTVNKLKEMGLNIVMVGEYLEIHPLAKAEWLKFISQFYESGSEAEKIFDTIASRYNTLAKEVVQARSLPKIMLGLPFNGTWYIAGGKSYVAKLMADAGGNYIWGNIDSRESVPIDFETIIEKSTEADLWLNTGDANSKKDILAVDSRLASIKPFVSGNLYNNDAIQNNSGGNDYWESGVVNPHIILNDLIAIFHPELCKDYQLHYYKRIK